MSFKTIYNMRMAGYLMTKGFVLLDIRENESLVGKKVFYFKESKELEKAMQEYLRSRNK